MSKPYFIVSFIIIFIFNIPAIAETLADKAGKKPIVITSDTLTADNKNSTAIFEGSVIAKTDDVTMYSDQMTVYYDNTKNKITKIHATGNVKVQKNERALFSKEAVYLNDERKIVFTGDPKAVEGENVITGTQIIFYLNDDRAVVEGSKVFLQNKQGLK